MAILTSTSPMNPKNSLSLSFITRIALFLLCAVAVPSFGQVPRVHHVFIVMEENHSYSSVVGNSSMPFLNSLISRYGLATQDYANAHPSIGNYFMLTTGRIITNNDTFSGTVSNDNIVRHFLIGGKTWKAYIEGLPSVGYTGGNSGLYLKHHNPFAYFTDVINSSSERRNLVPFSGFASDLNNNLLPDYSFITPNACNDAHDCSLATADSWLHKNVGGLIASSTFQQGGILIIVFDESKASDTAHGGGRVAMVVVSPWAKSGYKSKTFYQHHSTLRLTMQSLGMAPNLGASISAASMAEFFK